MGLSYRKCSKCRKCSFFIIGVALFKTIIRLVSVDKCLQVNTLVNACQCVLGCVLCVKSKTFPQLHAIHKLLIRYHV